jgi:cobalt-zinc-cadmium efflux system membrane fusion protein
MKVTQQITVAALCLSACLVVLSGCSQRQAAGGANALGTPKIEGDKIIFPPNAPQLGYLTIQPVQDRKVVVSALSGRLAWDEDITARVLPPVSGRVIEILANSGQSVAAGDTLAKIKSPDFGQAQADARKAVSDLKKAERTLDRFRELMEHGAAAEKDMQAAETDYARALADKERALATLSLYGGNTDSVDGVFSLKAPIGGVVVEKSVNPGQEVRSDQVADKPLFVISDPTRLWLFLDVTETDVASLSSNQEVLIRARVFPDKVFHGRVKFISEGLDVATRTIKARCVVDNSEKLLRAEMYVMAEVAVSTTSEAEIPTKAVFLKNNEQYVFIETESGQFQRRKVKLGLEGNGRSVVLDGLYAGQRVVTDGSLLLQAMLEGATS